MPPVLTLTEKKQLVSQSKYSIPFSSVSPSLGPTLFRFLFHPRFLVLSPPLIDRWHVNNACLLLYGVSNIFSFDIVKMIYEAKVKG